jgi:hypothetical protein
MPYKRKKGGQRLMDMARKSRKAKESRVGGKRYITPLPKTKAKAKTKTAVTKRGGTTITYKPKPSPQLKPKVRKFTAKEKAQYREKYERTARAKPPQKPKSKATKKPVVTPPKGTERPGANLTKRLTTIRKKAASSKAARNRTALQTPKGAGRVKRADLTKQQKALVAEGKKISKRLGMGPERFVGNLSVKRAEQIGVPIELAGWALLALATRGKLGTGKKVAGKWSKLKKLFGKKPGVMGGVGEVRAAGAAARGSGLGAARTAEQIAKAERARKRAEKLDKARKAATKGGGYGKPG